MHCLLKNEGFRDRVTPEASSMFKPIPAKCVSSVKSGGGVWNPCYSKLFCGWCDSQSVLQGFFFFLIAFGVAVRLEDAGKKDMGSFAMGRFTRSEEELGVPHNMYILESMPWLWTLHAFHGWTSISKIWKAPPCMQSMATKGHISGIPHKRPVHRG